MLNTPVVQRVLVPLDGSTDAKHALGAAVRMARQHNCPLDLVTVYDPVEQRWERALDDIADGLDYEQVEVSVVGAGWPGDVIIDKATEQPGTLTCLTAQHRDQVDRLVFGSVSSHIIRNSSGAPIMVVGPRCPAQPLSRPYCHLIICMDGSVHARAGVALAEKWAVATGMSTELVHVAGSGPSESTRTELRSLTDDLARRDIDTTHTILESGEPAAAIARLTSERPDALVVAATHGRTALAQVLTGSQTPRLVSRCPAPLLIVRPF